jgi:hypothetical protein
MEVLFVIAGFGVGFLVALYLTARVRRSHQTNQPKSERITEEK